MPVATSCSVAGERTSRERLSILTRQKVDPRSRDMMAVSASIKAKVCLVGEIAVGKTSLVRRFSLGTFDELYSTTLGISVSKKVVQPRNAPPGGPQRVEMILFDVMGQRRMRDVLVESYFKGAQALLAVWDITRPETLRELPKWIDMAWEVAGRIPVVIATNKADLSADRRFETVAADDMARESVTEWFTTSAKTGENVEVTFERLAVDLLRRHASRPPPRKGSETSPRLEAIARGLVEDSRPRLS